MARARLGGRRPSTTMTRSSLSGAFWIYGTTIIGRPDWNNVLSAISSSTALLPGSALADDGEIEAPGNAAELVAGAPAAAGAERQRLGREAGARC